MPITRRSFFGLATAAALTPKSFGNALLTPAQAPTPASALGGTYDPWIEIDAEALRFNAQELSNLSFNRPILAVVKNNAYGLGEELVAPILDPLPEIAGFATVTPDSCLALRKAGVKKPILLMGLTPDQPDDLIAQDIWLSICNEDDPKRMAAWSKKFGKTIGAHYYIDTGMSRMGIPYFSALPVMQETAAIRGIQIHGTMMTFTEDTEFDKEQLLRFNTLSEEATQLGIPLGKRHAVSSYGMYHFHDGLLDMVRPGIALYGVYPSDALAEQTMRELRCAFRLQARIVRVEQLRPGDSVSYGRNFIAQEPTWVATIPVGHADGLSRASVKGGRAVIGDAIFDIIGAVSASHCIINLGKDKRANVGDTVTLLGQGYPDVSPDLVAMTIKVSPYDLLMHLNPTIRRVVIQRS